MAIKYTPDSYVHASHFVKTDSGALFGALKDIGNTVGLVIIEDPSNYLLRRHAEILANSFEATVGLLKNGQTHPSLAMRMMELAADPNCRENNIERELKNLEGLMRVPELGVFAIYGAQKDISAFVEAHLRQPDPR